MPFVVLTGQATPDHRKSDGGNVTRCAGKDKEIVFMPIVRGTTILLFQAIRIDLPQKNAPETGASFLDRVPLL